MLNVLILIKWKSFVILGPGIGKVLLSWFGPFSTIGPIVMITQMMLYLFEQEAHWGKKTFSWWIMALIFTYRHKDDFDYVDNLDISYICSFWKKIKLASCTQLNVCYAVHQNFQTLMGWNSLMSCHFSFVTIT